MTSMTSESSGIVGSGRPIESNDGCPESDDCPLVPMYRIMVIGRTPSYVRFAPQQAIAASCTAPLTAKYIFTSHSRALSSGALPPSSRWKPGVSATLLASTFQWPGGVSDVGPSAQYSAITRPKSPRFTSCGV